jgi:fatty-acyl-CoA synthase
VPKAKTTTRARAAGIYERDLDRNAANCVPLTPIDFLTRSASVFARKTAIIHGARRITWAQMHQRCIRFASALRGRGIRRGDTVAILAPNVPALLEAHFAVPMAGAVLNALNYRLDAATIAFILDHGEAKLLLVDREFAPVARQALVLLGRRLPVVDIADALLPRAEAVGATEYEAFLKEGAPDDPIVRPRDEWDAICLLYTSGTTGNPKGVVYHHRGAYLNALGNALTFGLTPRSVYLWTLPMFHCSGWTYTWAASAVGATHVCLRRVEPAPIFELIGEHGVTHMCGAPIVLNMLIHAPADARRRPKQRVEVATGGAAPPSAVIAAMEAMNFHVTHLYGLTESYGPSAVCVEQSDWEELPPNERAAMLARQGVRYPTLNDLAVLDPESMAPVPGNGATLGELMLRGNTLMKGYLKNPKATRKAFKGGWFHTGDLAVRHRDGYVEIKDRSKDIIISGGENISSLEVEEVLYRHQAVMEAAVVAKPDPKWGETPCAFVALKPNAPETAASDIIAWCRQNLAGYKAPRYVVFGPLPKTSTGKIQKFVLRERAKTI